MKLMGTAAPMEAVGFIIDGGQEAKTEILENFGRGKAGDGKVPLESVRRVAAPGFVVPRKSGTGLLEEAGKY
jgi:hypothetical protein